MSLIGVKVKPQLYIIKYKNMWEKITFSCKICCRNLTLDHTRKLKMLVLNVIISIIEKKKSNKISLKD